MLNIILSRKPKIVLFNNINHPRYSLYTVRVLALYRCYNRRSSSGGKLHVSFCIFITSDNTGVPFLPIYRCLRQFLCFHCNYEYSLADAKGHNALIHS